MSAHTPGPWSVDFADDTIISASRPGLSICGIDAIDVGGTKGWQRDNEAYANARLIAEAPTLLAEVRRSADTFADLAQTFRLFGYPVAAEACLVAEKSNRAVIAKTEAA